MKHLKNAEQLQEALWSDQKTSSMPWRGQDIISNCFFMLTKVSIGLAGLTMMSFCPK